MQIKLDKEEQDRLVKHIEDTTELLNNAQDQLSKEMKVADKCFASMADLAKPEDRSKVISITQQANALINKIRAGGDKEKLIQQIKNLGNLK